MEIIFVLMAISLCMAGAGLAAFIWANRNGQFDDLETPSQAVLIEDQRSGSQPGQN